MVPSFVIPRLLTELILPGFNYYFTRKNWHISYSAVIASSENRGADVAIKIERLRETVILEMEITGAGDQEKMFFENGVRELIRKGGFILHLVSGREIKEISLTDKFESTDLKNRYQFSIGLRKDEKEIILIIRIPGRFFNILIPPLDTSYKREDIDEQLTAFFKKPDITCPSVKHLISILDSTELSGLLDLLKRNNLLSDYQLVLLINGYPEYSLKIKNALSKNRQESLREELKKYKGKVTKEDISCGIYSVEESISQILKKEKNYITDHFKVLSSLIKKITDYELYMRKEWPDWITEMDQKKLLYKTLIRCSDEQLKSAFADYSDNRYPFFKRDFPSSKINELFSGTTNRFPLSLSEARSAIIKSYRKLSAVESSYDHGDFIFILSSVEKNRDFEIIVRNTGWYILSTALKQCNRKLVDRVLSGINHPASVLIKGVISGTINPDIIHDEIQVSRARNECVRVILELYEDGIIEMDF